MLSRSKFYATSSSVHRRASALACLVGALVAACGSSASHPEAESGTDVTNVTDAGAESTSDAASDATADAAARPDSSVSTPLGMNDVTIVIPPPTRTNSPVLLQGTDLADDMNPLVPRELFDRLAQPALLNPILAADDYGRLQLVAVRFDLCDRLQPGPCAAGEDGRLRLVFQHLLGFQTATGQPDFMDATLHAFYLIPNAQLAQVVTELRKLAAMQGEPLDSPLKPSPALSDPAQPAYTEALRKLVRARALKTRLVRLAMNAQPEASAAIHWELRAVELRSDGSFHDMEIAGSTSPKQEVFLQGVGYQVTPATDSPQGIGGVLNATSFTAASALQKQSMLELLVATDNPLKQGLNGASCVACHTSTVLLDARSKEAGVDSKSLAGAYASTQNLSIAAGKLPERARTLRALGYMVNELMISRRVVNETAQVLTEIEQRYP